MAKEYRVWNGVKFKGRWTDRGMAARYMAISDPGTWRLVEFQNGHEVKDVSDDVIAKAKKVLDAEQAEFARKAAEAPEVHRLTAVGIGSGSGARN